ncbi:hypothetical protein PF005_g29854 [Phytophthora fragariae]|uniref:Uncharacterized protein n=1 Tax=Phytophthora fragariae TaxID=53985 RepID=A0A6A3VE67_9STRA|nr:hypothetical protein PF005_g29854 [Phytophthora fragariae]
MIDSQKGPPSTIQLDQANNGIHWTVRPAPQENVETNADRKKLQKYQSSGSIVFYAHPLCHNFPWKVPEPIANKHVVAALKKQPFRKYKCEGGKMNQFLDKLTEIVKTSGWQQAVMQ